MADSYELVIPPETVGGEYAVEVGMYDLSSGDRLPVFDSSGQRVCQDRILLTTVKVIR